jgi:hypothetical protein
MKNRTFGGVGSAAWPAQAAAMQIIKATAWATVQAGFRVLISLLRTPVG